MYKQSKPRYLFTTSHQQAGVQPLQGKQGSSHRMASWEDKCHHCECHTLPPSLPRLFQHDPAWYGISLWSTWASCSSYVPSQILVHPQSPCWQGTTRSWKALGFVQVLCKESNSAALNPSRKRVTSEMLAMQYKSSSNKIEQCELLVQDRNVEVNQQQKYEH